MAERNVPILKSLGIEVGTKAYHTKTITEADVLSFADVSGDFNPVHMSEEFARKTSFGGRIVHGVLILGLISAAIAKLPGLAVYMSQTATFLKPVRIGDSITATAEVIDTDDIKGIIQVRTICMNTNNETIVDGEARIKIFEQPSL